MFDVQKTGLQTNSARLNMVALEYVKVDSTIAVFRFSIIAVSITGTFHLPLSLPMQLTIRCIHLNSFES